MPVPSSGPTDAPIMIVGEALPPRVEAKIERIPESGCWVWIGALSGNGYGSLWWEGKTRSSHIVVYELLVGPVADGLVLDHICRTPCCCNPYHLEPVTESINIKRGTAWHHFQGLTDMCQRGHEWGPHNTIYGKDGRRRCRACRAACQMVRRKGGKIEDYL